MLNFIKKKYNKFSFFIILLVFPVIIISTIIQFKVFPEKYFVDSNYILNLMDNNIEKEGTAFYVTAELFKKINIFQFSSLLEWSIFFGIIFGFAIFIRLLKNDNYSLFDYFFIFLSVGLLTFNVFNLSKDIIQFVIFGLINIVLMNDKFSERKKIALSSLILLLETFCFRSYYILVLLGYLICYFLFKFGKGKIKGFRWIFFSVIIFLVIISFSKGIFPEGYNKIINVRDTIVNQLDVNTEIRNLISNDNNLFFYLNYIINLFRIMLPIELVTRGSYYLLFVAFQISLLYIVLKGISLTKSNDSVVLPISLIIGYFMCSAIYEPDFGSVVRHEMTLFYFYIIILDYIRLSKNLKS